MRMQQWVGCAAFLVLASGCSGSGSSSSSGGGVTAAQACDAQVDADCGILQRCAPFYLTYLYGDMTACKTRLRLNCESNFSKNGVRATPTEAKACADATAAESCSTLYSGDTLSQCDTTAGSLTNGTTCGNAAQCESTACRFPANATCGTCTAPVSAGGSCANGEICAKGLTCANNGNCVTPGGAGSTCGANSPCKGTLVCNNGTCGSALAAGSNCNPQADACDGTAGLFCNPSNSQCQSVAFANAGQPCGLVGGGLTACSAHGFCNRNGGASGTCVAAAADGATCNTNTGPDCMLPANCINGTCQLPGVSCN